MISTPQAIDRYAAKVDAGVKASVYEGTRVPTEWRRDVLARDFEDADALRQLAGKIKQHTLDHLDTYLSQAERALKQNGAEVYFAETVDRAKDLALQVLKRENVRVVAKSKSMLTEELHLNAFLAKHEIECIETDLGEYVIQIDDDVPSHIIKPIVHKNRRDIAKSFVREGLGDYNDDPETITLRARNHLRAKFLAADCGMTGANFVSAESGRIVMVTNEGNGRWCTTAPRLHLVMVGIEKLVPRDKDLGLYLNLLARSAVGQQLTVYTQFVGGPRSMGKDGPDKMVVIFVDNGRSSVLGGECHEILRALHPLRCLPECVPCLPPGHGSCLPCDLSGSCGSSAEPAAGGQRFS